MKKVMLVLILGIFLFSTSSFSKQSQNIQLSSSSDCVAYAREQTLIVAGFYNEHPNDDWDFYSQVYAHFYSGCVDR